MQISKCLINVIIECGVSRNRKLEWQCQTQILQTSHIKRSSLMLLLFYYFNPDLNGSVFMLGGGTMRQMLEGASVLVSNCENEIDRVQRWRRSKRSGVHENENHNLVININLHNHVTLTFGGLGSKVIECSLLQRFSSIRIQLFSRVLILLHVFSSLGFSLHFQLLTLHFS